MALHTMYILYNCDVSHISRALLLVAWDEMQGGPGKFDGGGGRVLCIAHADEPGSYFERVAEDNAPYHK